MENIKWCLNAKNGIELITPNDNLSKAYISKASNALISIKLNKIPEWKIATSYYSSYFSVYAILMKIGVKCEIHKCTINFIETFLKEYFTKEDIDYIKNSLKTRNQLQYYINKNISDKNLDKIIKNAPIFHVRCKEILSKLTQSKIRNIRGEVSIN